MLKKFIRECMVITGLFAALSGMYCSAATKEKVLNIYNWSDYLDKEAIAEFEKRFGVRVNYDVYDSNETLLAKLQFGVTGFDVIFPSDYMVEILANSGYLEPLNLSKLPNIINLDERFLKQPFDPENTYSLPYAWGATGIGFRADKVIEPITSWKALFDPTYSGHIVMLDDMRETLGAALKSLGYSYNSTSPEELLAAKQLLISQKPLVKVYNNAQPTMLVSGDAWLAHNWSSYTYAIAQDDANIRFVIPQEGSVRFVDNVAIPKNAPHKELAHEFLNFLLEPEIDAKNHNYIRCPTPNKAAVPLLTPTLQEVLTQITPDMLEKLEYLRDLGEATQMWDRIWTEFKAE